MRNLIIPILALAAVGCSSSGTRTVSGQLDLTQMQPVNGQVVAISSAGHVFRAPISATGAFNISLPTNAHYTLRFSNATNVQGRFDTFATLAARRGGATTHWFNLTSGAAIQLGRVARAGTVTQTASGLHTASDDGSGDGESGQAGDQGEHEDDNAQACDLSGGQDDIDVESEHDVNDQVDTDKDGKPDSMDDGKTTSCASKSDEGCELSDNETKELDDEADQSCGGGGSGGGGGSPVPTPVPGVIK